MDSKKFEIGLREAKLQSGWFLVKRENLETVGSSSSLIHGLGSRESQSASTGDKSANRRGRRRREGKGSRGCRSSQFLLPVLSETWLQLQLGPHEIHIYVYVFLNFYTIFKGYFPFTVITKYWL